MKKLIVEKGKVVAVSPIIGSLLYFEDEEGNIYHKKDLKNYEICK